MENKNEKSNSENKETSIFPTNNLNQDNDKSIVKDLKESLKQTVDQTLDTLEELLITVESTIEDKSIYEVTKEIVHQINSEVYIFDRFGKLLTQINTFDGGWDGTFNGALLPNSDYWFSVKLPDNRTFTGHFTLKR